MSFVFGASKLLVLVCKNGAYIISALFVMLYDLLVYPILIIALVSAVNQHYIRVIENQVGVFDLPHGHTKTH
jgi:hypothetical protein